MLSLFRQKINGRTKENAAKEKLAYSVVSTCIRIQRKWADIMQRYTERLSQNNKVVALTLFCLLSGSLSIYLIANSIMCPKATSFSIVHVKPSPYSLKSGDEETKASVFITKTEYERIERLRYHRDRLARSPSSKTIYDSIINQRPGLMDSVILLEKIYQSQLKK